MRERKLVTTYPSHALRYARSELFLGGLSLIPQRPLYPHWRWQISLWAERETERETERERAGLKQAEEKIRLLLILQILG